MHKGTTMPLGLQLHYNLLKFQHIKFIINYVCNLYLFRGKYSTHQLHAYSILINIGQYVTTFAQKLKPFSLLIKRGNKY